MDRLTLNFRAFLTGLALLTAVGLIAFNVKAADISGTFTYPTQFEDGSALTLVQIAAVRVEYGSCAGTAFGTKAGEVSVAPPATAFTITGLSPGTYCLRAYTRTTAAAGGLDSAPTGVVSKVIPFPPPKPPTFTVVNVVAYEITEHRVFGLRLARDIGRVPLGTACGGETVLQSGGSDYHAVPVEAVDLFKMPKSAVVVAACEAAG